LGGGEEGEATVPLPPATTPLITYSGESRGKQVSSLIRPGGAVTQTVNCWHTQLTLYLVGYQWSQLPGRLNWR